MSKLSDRIDYLITGVSSGLGKALALELLDQNYSVLGLSRQAAPELYDFSRFQFQSVDLTDLPALNLCLGQFRIQNAPERIILNAAAIQSDTLEGSFHPEIYSKLMELNLHCNIRIISRFVPLFRQRGHGTLCAISSLSAVRSIGVGGLGYAASKAALVSVFESLRLDPLNSALQFTTVFPATMSAEKSWPLTESYHSSARKIICGISLRKERLYIPRWKHILLVLSKCISDRWLVKILQWKFKTNPFVIADTR